MSFGSILPAIFYELVFIATFVFVPVVAFRGDLENYFFGMIVLYLCSKIIRRRSSTQLPAEGRAVFVSGCDSEYGCLTAQKLDELGYKVFVGCMKPDSERIVKLKSECSEKLQIVQVDVTNDESVKNAEKIVTDNLSDQGLWAVVNDAGLDGFGDFELCGVDTYKRLMDVNYFGTVRLTQQFLPLLRKSKGRVIIMSSIMASFPRPATAAYSASKMAVQCIGDCLRMEMSKFGVTVCSIQSPMFMGTSDDETNIKQMYQSVEGSWGRLSDDVKSTYSTTYLKAQLGALAKFRISFGSKTPDAVIDAVVEAVSGSSPPSTKTVHGGPFMVDPVVVYASTHPYLPESLSDWILRRLTGHSDTQHLVLVYASIHPYLPESLSDWILRRLTGHSDTQLLLMSQQMTNGHSEKKDK